MSEEEAVHGLRGRWEKAIGVKAEDEEFQIWEDRIRSGEMLQKDIKEWGEIVSRMNAQVLESWGDGAEEVFEAERGF